MKWLLPAGIAAALAILALARPTPVARTAAIVTKAEPRATLPDPLPQAAPAQVPAAASVPRRSTIRERSGPLGFDPSTAQAFEATRQVVRAELERIHREMGKVFATLPVDLPDDQLQEIQQRVEDRFRGEKEAAFSRLDAFLDSRQAHQELRARLEASILEAP